MLSEAFVLELEKAIVYNARVTRVEQRYGDGSVIAHYQYAGNDISLSGDYLLTTAIAKATSFIKFVPNLDYEKQEAFRRVNYVGATKIRVSF